MKQKMAPNQFGHALQDFQQGFELAFHPKLRAFVLIPLMINVLLFVSAFIWLLNQFNTWIDALLAPLPDFFTWLHYILWPLMLMSILVIFAYIFTIVANFIAAPFNGLLSEKAEALLCGESQESMSWSQLVADTPRILWREVQKLVYYLPRIVVILILMVIPVIGQTIGPILSFLFASWMLTIQYGDYPFDNHKVPFMAMRKTLAQKPLHSLSFGAIVMGLSMIPLVNLVIMPVAVCAATQAWVRHYKTPTVHQRQQRQEAVRAIKNNRLDS
ncbi:Sulfate transporter CysZ [Vibrio stylophorae]|uniref:Sulfate transporter CysZ n=1 Tax=Vibrio stylophorae TaxID=659351 RepID=A0ABN8DST8_9VIBR|nr:sulfate transporter CysZ [Vibrio stylophorae]CAH0534159.1 Sulfate transporter CysZ [Vibrio stylophorae]